MNVKASWKVLWSPRVYRQPGRQSILTDEQKKAIRESYHGSQYISYRKLAEIYGVSYQTIYNVIHPRKRG